MDNIVRRCKLHSDSALRSLSRLSTLVFQISCSSFFFYKYFLPQVLNKTDTVGLGISLPATNNILKYFYCVFFEKYPVNQSKPLLLSLMRELFVVVISSSWDWSCWTQYYWNPHKYYEVLLLCSYFINSESCGAWRNTDWLAGQVICLFF